MLQQCGDAVIMMHHCPINKNYPHARSELFASNISDSVNCRKVASIWYHELPKCWKRRCCAKRLPCRLEHFWLGSSNSVANDFPMNCLHDSALQRRQTRSSNRPIYSLRLWLKRRRGSRSFISVRGNPFICTVDTGTPCWRYASPGFHSAR